MALRVQHTMNLMKHFVMLQTYMHLLMLRHNNSAFVTKESWNDQDWRIRSINKKLTKTWSTTRFNRITVLTYWEKLNRVLHQWFMYMTPCWQEKHTGSVVITYMQLCNSYKTLGSQFIQKNHRLYHHKK